MSVTATLEGDSRQLLERLKKLKTADRRGALRTIAEGLRTSTVERFGREEDPEGNKWTTSIRVSESGGKTLTKTGMLKASIRSEVNSGGLAVGTNDIRAATHQFGAERTIRAKNKKNLKFKIGNRWISKAAVHITIPARPYLGVSEEDQREIQEVLETFISD